MNDFTDFWHQHCPTPAHTAAAAAAAGFFHYNPNNNSTNNNNQSDVSAPGPPTDYATPSAPSSRTTTTLFPTAHHPQLDTATAAAVAVSMCHNASSILDSSGLNPGQPGHFAPAVHQFPSSFFGVPNSQFGNPFQTHHQQATFNMPGLPLSAAAAAIAASARGSPFKGEHVQRHSQHPLLRADELLLQQVSMAPCLGSPPTSTTTASQLFDLSNQTVITTSMAGREEANLRQHRARLGLQQAHLVRQDSSVTVIRNMAADVNHLKQGAQHHHHRIDISRTASIPIESSIDTAELQNNNNSSSTSSSSHQQPSSLSQQPQMTCQVCYLAASNGLHFGARTCAACAAFFRRSISDQKRYICKRSQRCVIRPGEAQGYRKMCRNCRMKRCLEIGMLPENVQNKRHRRDFFFAVDSLTHNNDNSSLSQGAFVSSRRLQGKPHHHQQLHTSKPGQSHKSSMSSDEGEEEDRLVKPKMEATPPATSSPPNKPEMGEEHMAQTNNTNNSNENTNPFGNGMEFGSQGSEAMSLLSRCCPPSTLLGTPTSTGVPMDSSAAGHHAPWFLAQLPLSRNV
uniref:Nuclear receptor domain-containing protein n=1 Tax=Ditylenchus dipsaci TaxID=166011 RepID=A0A915ELN2_9BILA